MSWVVIVSCAIVIAILFYVLKCSISCKKPENYCRNVPGGGMSDLTIKCPKYMQFESGSHCNCNKLGCKSCSHSGCRWCPSNGTLCVDMYGDDICKE